MPSLLLEVFGNNPSTTVTSGGTAALAGGTAETWTVTSSASFPAILAGATQFHVADPQAPGEVITVTAISGTTWTVTRGAEGSATAAHAPGFTVTQVVTAAVLADMLMAPWQFNVQAYGAKGDGQCVTDGAMSSSSSTTTLTCATSTPFKASDIGKAIMVVGAAASTPGITTLSTTISGYTSAGVVTLAAACVTTVSSAIVLWSSDDTAAFQAAINAASAYALANLCDVEVAVPDAPAQFWGIAGPLVTGSPTFGNAQLTLPVIPVAGQKVALTIKGVGTVPGGTGQYHWAQVPPQFNGSTIVSYGVFATATAMGTSVTTYGNPSVIGGPDGPQGYGTSASGPLFSNMLCTLQGLVIMTPLSLDALNYCCFNFFGISQANVIDTCLTAATTYLDTWGAGKSMTTAGYSFGGIFPANGNNDNNVVDHFAVSGGFRRALLATEHTVIHRAMLLYCYSALCVVGSYLSSVGALHAVWADQLSVEGCHNVVEILGAGTSGSTRFDIAQLDTEGSPAFADDGGGGLAGAVGRVTLVGGAAASSISSGATLLEIICNAVNPGPATAWTLVASTAYQNTQWRWANVTLYGGATVTAVAVGATRGGASAPTMTSVYTQTSAALPPLAVRVPPGGWLKVTCGTIPANTVTYD
jgi:hypothetical protein